MELKPYQGIGNLQFGISRRDILQLIGEPVTRFRKVPSATSLTDAYDSLGLHLYYDDTDVLTFIDAFKPCDLIYDGIKLVDRRTEELLQELSAAKIDYLVDSLGATIKTLGIALYAPGIDEEGDWVEGVSIFKTPQELPSK